MACNCPRCNRYLVCRTQGIVIDIRKQTFHSTYSVQGIEKKVGKIKAGTRIIAVYDTRKFNFACCL